jgi:hypothetical protein
MKIRKFLVLICAAAIIGFAAVSCSNDDDVKPDYSVITFENAQLNSDGILREHTLIGEDEWEMGDFWEAYSEQGITFRSYVATAYTFWCGFTISGNHNMTVGDYTNESSVYNTKGQSGSKFALCYDGTEMLGDEYKSQFYVADGSDKVFDHVYLTNSTLAALSMLNGDAFCKKFTYGDKDWFKVTITGFDHTGAEKGSVDFYLADFRTTSSVGVVTDWTKVDLRLLGAVQRVEFSLSSTDNGAWGMNTPAYFCLDDLALRD